MLTGMPEVSDRKYSSSSAANHALANAVGNAIGYTYRRAKKIVILVIGLTVGLLGLIMLVTPGPGIVMLVTALAILATEFVWARVWLKRLKQGAADGVRKTRGIFGRRKVGPAAADHARESDGKGGRL